MKNSQLTTIYLIRHGQSEGNIQHKWGLTPEVNLTEKGRTQVKETANKLATVHFHAVFACDFVRAIQTAEIIALERNLVVHTKQALQERSYGRMNGKTQQEMKDELGELYHTYFDLPAKEKFYAKLVEDMESTDEALQRLLLALREIAIAYEGKTALVVSHVTLMRALLIHLGFCDFHEINSETCIERIRMRIPG
ncbi:histidine phosphatase family protein [Candidatus Roizmanbacteria bacterium]|nr:histidine phosphatase family protein [Candidatus Roizmanbacteria bacterium]